MASILIEERKYIDKLTFSFYLIINI